MKPALVGDIGGTHARFALWRDGALASVRVLATADYAGPEQAVARYLADLGLAPGDLASLCLAVAGPVGGEVFRFTNNHWRLDREALRRSLGVEELRLVNDFSAMALGMTRLRAEHRQQLRPGVADPQRPALVIGPGTGLGVGILLPLGDGRWQALPGEGGHVDLPVGSPREAAIWRHLHHLLGHVSAESVLSGKGLERLYQALRILDGQAPATATAAQVSAAALAGDALAREALDLFCTWLGRVAGNAVLTLGGRGGVYLAGGMLPRFADFVRQSGFARAFAEKGCMSGYLEGIPVWLVTGGNPGLEGAGISLQQGS